MEGILSTDKDGLRPQPDSSGFGPRLRRLLVAGLVVLVPLALTAYVLYRLFELMDGMFAPVLVRATGWNAPGLGLLLTFAFILLLGWLSTSILGRRLISLGEMLLQRIPVGRTVYSASKSVLQVLAERPTDAFKRVVLIEHPRPGMFAVAFVTGRACWPQIHQDLADARLVFLPTSPNPTSGFLLIVPDDQIVDLPIPVEEGVRLVISGGLVSPRLAPVEATPVAAVERSLP